MPLKPARSAAITARWVGGSTLCETRCSLISRTCGHTYSSAAYVYSVTTAPTMAPSTTSSDALCSTRPAISSCSSQPSSSSAASAASSASAPPPRRPRLCCQRSATSHRSSASSRVRRMCTCRPNSPTAALSTHGKVASAGVKKCRGRWASRPRLAASSRKRSLLLNALTSRGAHVSSRQPSAASCSRWRAIASAARSLAGSNQQPRVGGAGSGSPPRHVSELYAPMPMRCSARCQPTVFGVR
mmetsp:Transcript_8593/g.27365  ORF Transcript_8593/g.27365 Transcript_8593/m.27365 type:complete len:243 (+) Transcript_8593:250-978(+)